LQGSARAETGLPPYVRIYVMIDGSASMGLGATSTDQDRLHKETGCALACQLPEKDGSATSYERARNMNPPVTTRIDVVRSAVQAMALRAEQVSRMQNQIKFGVYVFSNDVSTLVDINSSKASNHSAVHSALDNLTLADRGGGTDMHAAFHFLEKVVFTGGTGASESSPLSYVLFLSDGVESASMRNSSFDFVADPTMKNQLVAPTSNFDGEDSTYSFNGKTEKKSGFLQALDPSLCAPLKKPGVALLPLEIDYVVPPSKYRLDPAGDPELRFNWIEKYLLKTSYVNGASMTLLEERMRACASGPNDYYKASSSADIKSAIASMFDKALLSTTRLTK
jgi:hypothetical protein